MLSMKSLVSGMSAPLVMDGSLKQMVSEPFSGPWTTRSHADNETAVSNGMMIDFAFMAFFRQNYEAESTEMGVKVKFK